MGAFNFFKNVFQADEDSRLLVKHLNILTAQQQELKKLLQERCHLIYRICDEISQIQKIAGDSLTNKELEVLLEACKSYQIMALSESSFIGQITGESKISELLQQIDLSQLQEKIIQKLNVDISILQQHVERYDRLLWRLENAINKYDHRVELMKGECEKLQKSSNDQMLLHHAENFFSIKEKLFPASLANEGISLSAGPKP